MLGQNDVLFSHRVDRERQKSVHLLHLKPDQGALELWKEACVHPKRDTHYNPHAHHDRDAPLLIIPLEYDILEGVGDIALQLGQLLRVRSPFQMTSHCLPPLFT